MPRPQTPDAKIRYRIRGVRRTIGRLEDLLKTDLSIDQRILTERELRLATSRLHRLEGSGRPPGRPAKNELKPSTPVVPSTKKREASDADFERLIGLRRPQPSGNNDAPSVPVAPSADEQSRMDESLESLRRLLGTPRGPKPSGTDAVVNLIPAAEAVSEPAHVPVPTTPQLPPATHSAPTIRAYTAPSTIVHGAHTNIFVEASGASQVVVSDSGGLTHAFKLTGGVKTVFPAHTTQFTATATGPGGQAEASTQVVVLARDHRPTYRDPQWTPLAVFLATGQTPKPKSKPVADPNDFGMGSY